MTLKDIIAVSGQPGLFKTIATSRNGIIVENIETEKKSTIPATMRVSSLEDIAIFTIQDEKPLKQVFEIIREKLQGGSIISHKSDPEKIKAFFAEILPEYDESRVYASDMKKVINWFSILQTHNLLDLINDSEEESKDSTEQNSEEAK